MPESLPVAGTAIILRDAPAGLEVLLIRRPDRGSFAGAWVFPGGKVEDGDHVEGATEPADAERAAIRETEEEVGLVVGPLVPLSRWEPPAQVPTRIRTWFFLAESEGGELVPSPGEVVEAVWIRPAEALVRHASGGFTLFPPTWVTLDWLSAFADPVSAREAAGTPLEYRTQMEGQTFRWGAARLDTGELPWRFSRS